MYHNTWNIVTGKLFQAILILVTASYLCQSIYDVDFFWYLTLGHWIKAHKTVPIQDYWTEMLKDQTWYALSWLFSFSVSLTEKLFGAHGLIFLKLLCTLITISAFTFSFSSRSKNIFFGTLLSITVACGTLLQSKFDPLLLGLGLFAFILELTYQYCKQPKKPPPLLLLTLVFTLYGNLHSSVILAFLIGLFFLKASDYDAPPSFVKYSLTFLPVIFLNPYLGKQIPFAIQSFLHSIQLELMNHSNASTIYHFDFGILLILSMLLAQLCYFAPVKPKPLKILPTIFFILLSFWSRAFTPYALVILGFAISETWGKVSTSELGNIGLGISTLQTKLAKLNPVGPIFLASCIAFVNLVKLYSLPITELGLPSQELDYILSEDLPSPIIHPMTIGPYLIYRFSDEQGIAKRLAALDPRIEQTLPYKSILIDRLFKLKPGWDQVLDNINPQTILCPESSPLAVWLSYNPEWHFINNQKTQNNWIIYTKLKNNH